MFGNFEIFQQTGLLNEEFSERHSDVVGVPFGGPFAY
jgi:hypothetical protein